MEEEGLDGEEGNAEPQIPAPVPDQQTRLDALEEALAPLETVLDESDPAMDAGQRAWEAAWQERLDVKWLRIDFDWDHMEPQEGQYNWRDVDRVVDFAEKHDMRVMGSIAYTPRWASGVADRAAPPRDPNKYVAFVREVVRRYRGRIHALGIWNEK